MKELAFYIYQILDLLSVTLDGFDFFLTFLLDSLYKIVRKHELVGPFQHFH